MTVMIAVPPEQHAKAPVLLGAMLARSSGEDLHLCAIVPSAWPPSPARVDAEYRAYVEQSARTAIDEALALLPGDAVARTVVHHARSVPRGLLELAEREPPSVIVAGSSPGGPLGRVSLGGVTQRLLHGSAMPVALAPRGFRCPPDARVTRVTAAYGGTVAGDDLVVAAAGVAARDGTSLRIASFAVHARPPYTSGVGHEGEGGMLREWITQIRTACHAALGRAGQLPDELETVIGHGETWDEAIEDVDWDDGDVLVVGSSEVSPIARVFLGSRASKIVRNSPVPVIVVPRSVAAELVEEFGGATAGG